MKYLVAFRQAYLCTNCNWIWRQIYKNHSKYRFDYIKLKIARSLSTTSNLITLFFLVFGMIDNGVATVNKVPDTKVSFPYLVCKNISKKNEIEFIFKLGSSINYYHGCFVNYLYHPLILPGGPLETRDAVVESNFTARVFRKIIRVTSTGGEGKYIYNHCKEIWVFQYTVQKA